MTDQEFGAVRPRAGQRGPGGFREDLAVDDGAQRGAGLREASPALPVRVEAGVEGGELGGQVPGVDVAQGLGGGGRRAEPVRERGGDRAGSPGAVRWRAPAQLAGG
ncbi:hypothetical protein ACFVSX_12665 [Streptomyces rubiginosohelvolus]|uniref:hypothetical protein n=1 Tax=Streptomyces rubiginosohelvolus TaxID=67362 RepID=UPI0036DA1837